MISPPLATAVGPGAVRRGARGGGGGRPHPAAAVGPGPSGVGPWGGGGELGGEGGGKLGGGGEGYFFLSILKVPNV